MTYDLTIWLPQIVVVGDVTISGEEFLHCFFFALLNVAEVGYDNMIVGLNSKVMHKSSAQCFIIVDVDLSHGQHPIPVYVGCHLS